MFWEVVVVGILEVIWPLCKQAAISLMDILNTTKADIHYIDIHLKGNSYRYITILS